MKGIFGALIIMFAAFFIGTGTEAKVREIHKQEVYQFLQDAFGQQVRLSEEPRTKAEIKAILEPYFTETFIRVFMKENVKKVNGGYATLGTDFALYYIPFFTYGGSTEVIHDKAGRMIVLERFGASGDGPVTEDSHTESVALVKERGGWKITDVSYERNLAEKDLQTDTGFLEMDAQNNPADNHKTRSITEYFFDEPQALLSFGSWISSALLERIAAKI
ncbi:DUF3993 domain-containing protein [Peribacillus sp. SCS-155]|uniref:DUF3993 domain-containing protein n=1 Tax=Peribacillus sedimenti TaxID=3115297 RepID=UPI0039058E8A